MRYGKSFVAAREAGLQTRQDYHRQTPPSDISAFNSPHAPDRIDLSFQPTDLYMAAGCSIRHLSASKPNGMTEGIEPPHVGEATFTGCRNS
ncbi:hypothetical protein PFLUV_G00014190 [Perca fluviatilis]|uniref:Uncharacterized protein n=1 Tax=Perca fluviatilis TaxID=8168 RepID=A0A6A5FSU7_PERFL|nr:hypothetical protein PFLUV_G00014190 [Perca fluviatilis]